MFVITFPSKMGIDGRKILQWVIKKIDVNTRNLVDSAHDRDYWRALVNAALNLRVP